MASAVETPGIARIVQRSTDGAVDEQHVGMAIVIDERHVITCCHVVNQVVGADNYCKSPPTEGQQIPVRFPYAQGTPREAKVVEWGLASEPSVDVAVLELTEPAPQEAGIATFSLDKSKGMAWACVGYDAEGSDGEARGELGAVLPRGYRQLNGTSGRSVQIEKGFSGAGLWCSDLKAYVGMVVSKDQDHARTGASYAILPKQLKSLHEIQLQVRPPAPIPPIWRGFAAIGCILLATLAYNFWPQPVVARIFDAETKDRILRGFTVKRGMESQVTEAGSTELVPCEQMINLGSEEAWGVVCPGFNGEPPPSVPT